MARDIEVGDVIHVEGCPPATVKATHPRGVTTTEGPLRFGLIDDLVQKGECEIDRSARLTAAVLGQAIADAFAPKPLPKELQDALAFMERLPSGHVDSDNEYLSAELRRRLDTLVNRGSIDAFRCGGGVTRYQAKGETLGTGYACAETTLPNGATTTMRTFEDYAPGDEQRVAREFREATKVVDDAEVFLPKIDRQAVMAETKARLRDHALAQEINATKAMAFDQLVYAIGLDVVGDVVRIGEREYPAHALDLVAKALRAMEVDPASPYDPFEGGEGKAAA